MEAWSSQAGSSCSRNTVRGAPPTVDCCSTTTITGWTSSGDLSLSLPQYSTKHTQDGRKVFVIGSGFALPAACGARRRAPADVMNRLATTPFACTDGSLFGDWLCARPCVSVPLVERLVRYELFSDEPEMDGSANASRWRAMRVSCLFR